MYVCARVTVCMCLMLHVGFYRSLHGDQAKLTERCVPSRENTEYVLNSFHLLSSYPIHSTRDLNCQQRSWLPLRTLLHVLCLFSGRVPQLYQSAGSQKRRPGLHLWYQWLQPHVQILQGENPVPGSAISPRLHHNQCIYRSACGTRERLFL